MAITMDRRTKLIVFICCFIKLSLHLLADYHSGFQGDELLHIETGNHLAFGYFEFPPMIGWLAFIQNLFLSQSVFVHHLFSHLAAILIFIYIAKTTVALGGKSIAVWLVLICLLPIMGRSHQLFQPVVFSQLFWVLSFYYLVLYVKLLERKYLWYVTITLALGFLTKYDIVFFITGLLSLFFFKTMRESLIRHIFWQHILLFLLIISPNIIWQYLHDFPAMTMFARLHETQLEQLSIVQVYLDLILQFNPFTVLLWLMGIVIMFHHSIQRYRVLGVSIFLAFLMLSISKGKAYYFYPILLLLLPFGGVFWQMIFTRSNKWLLYPLSIIILISGILLLPFHLPITSLQSYIENEYPYEKNDIPGGKYAIKEERYSKQKWHETLTALQEVYNSLPVNDQQETLIWGKHYGQAGAIALLGKNYNLPDAFSLHGSFYSWLPSGKMPTTVIALRYSNTDGSDFFEPYFEEVEAVKTIYNPYADNKERLYQTIFICKNPQQDFNDLKNAFKERIFE